MLALTQARVELALHRRGLYRLAIRWSPYWQASSGCLREGNDGMLRLAAPHAGHVSLRFAVDAERVLDAMTGSKVEC